MRTDLNPWRETHRWQPTLKIQGVGQLNAAIPLKSNQYVHRSEEAESIIYSGSRSVVNAGLVERRCKKSIVGYDKQGERVE